MNSRERHTIISLSGANRRKFGQHFICDQALIEAIVDSACINKEHVVLEIGTGFGNLTRAIAKVAKRVISYEIDKQLWAEAKKHLSNYSNVYLINDDYKNCTTPFDILVTSLPFSESADFITWLAQKKLIRAVAILQKDFVEKLLAPVGSRSYRSVSVISRIRFNIEKLCALPPSCFWPRPKVWALMVRMTPKSSPLTARQIKLIKLIFSFRGRTLRYFVRSRELPTTMIEGELLSARIEKMNPTQLQELINVIGEDLDVMP